MTDRRDVLTIVAALRATAERLEWGLADDEPSWGRVRFMAHVPDDGWEECDDPGEAAGYAFSGVEDPDQGDEWHPDVLQSEWGVYVPIHVAEETMCEETPEGPFDYIADYDFVPVIAACLWCEHFKEPEDGVDLDGLTIGFCVEDESGGWRRAFDTCQRFKRREP